MKTAKEIRNEANAKAIKRARQMLALSRAELALRLGISPKSIERIENGRSMLSDKRLLRTIEALGLTREDFQKVKRGKRIRPQKREVNVTENNGRRSYQKIITKECETLRKLRELKGYSQYKASELCGYSRATIGHIENGRIELSNSRIRHIYKSYGLTAEEYQDFLNNGYKKENLRVHCISLLEKLDFKGLELIFGLLENLVK